VTRRLGRRGKRSLEDTVFVELLALHSAFISPMAALLRNKVPRQRLAVLDDCEKACGIEQQAVVWLICAMAHAQIYRFGNVTMRVSTHHEHTPFSR